MSDDRDALLRLLMAEAGLEVEEPARIHPRDPHTRPPLSFSQQRLWYLHQLNPQLTMIVPHRLRITGALDTAVLTQTLIYLRERHESLRTTFREVDGRLYQHVDPDADCALEIIDLQSVPDETRNDTLEEQVQKLLKIPFDLAAGPLFRPYLFILQPEEHVLLLNVHHIISDGWSYAIIHRELITVYDAFAAGQPVPLEPPAVQYADFAAWQATWLESPEFTEKLAYWENHLSGTLPLIELPTDRPRSAKRGDNEDVGLKRMVDPELTAQIRDFSRAAGVTPSMMVLTALKVLLHRYTGETDIFIGSSIAGRSDDSLEEVVGFFVSTLLLRTDLGGQPTFSEALQRVQETTLAAYEHQDVPVEEIKRALGLQNSRGGEDLFRILYVYQNFPKSAQQSRRLTIRKEAGRTDRRALFDLSLYVYESGPQFEFFFEYDNQLFEKETMARLCDHLIGLLRTAVASPAAPIAAMPLLSAAEEKQLAQFAGEPTVAPAVDILARISQRATDQPAAPALQYGDTRYTYAELDHRANQLAHHLRDLGIGPETIVAVLQPRRPELIISLLAILKAGGAYLPLDPEYPQERLAYMIDDAQPVLILTYGVDLPAELAAGVPTPVSLATIPWETLSATPPDLTVDPAQLAYVIYTSGSTGRPKGVQISRGALSHFVGAAIESYGLTAADRVLQFATIAFDTAVEEIFPTLAQGATLVLRTDEMLDALDTFVDRCRQWGITFLDLPTAFWHQLTLALSESDLVFPEQIRLVIIGGEKAEQQLLVRWQEQVSPQVRLLNTYGPTETTVVATMYDVPAPPPPSPSGGVLIGRPLPGYTAYVVDAQGRQAPLGVPGELLLGGPALARGYLGRVELSAERFISNPFGDGRLYRTGDLARWRAEGDLEFMGRVDDQVKIRGFRVELGEIETILSRKKGVRQAVVRVIEQEALQRDLAAYLVVEDGLVAEDLRAYCQTRLPAYMIPATFTLLASLPLLPNGKIDRRSLPVPAAIETTPQKSAPPRTVMEAEVAALWSSLFKLPEIGIYDNFFALGGHSLSAIQLVSRLRSKFNVDLTVRTLFDAPTVAQLSVRISELRAAGTDFVIPVGARPSHIPLSSGQQRLYVLDRLNPGGTAYNLVSTYRLQGALQVAQMSRAVAALYQRHESLRTVFYEAAGRVWQRVNPPPVEPLVVEDFRHVPAVERETAVAAALDRLKAYRFDLHQGPLFRAHLLQVDGETHHLVLVMHHIIADGWSMGVIGRELSALYNGFLQGQEQPLRPLGLSYVDYALWQQNWLQGAGAERQLAYWREKLAGVNSAPLLRTDFRRPARQTTNGALAGVTVPAETQAALAALSRRTNTTLFMIMLAAFKLLLQRHSGRDDIIVGAPMANRNHPQLESLAGMFLNNLPLRTMLDKAETFRQLVERVRQTAVSAFENQDLPFENLLNGLNVPRDPALTPLFQVYFNMLTTGRVNLELPDLTVRTAAPTNTEARFDLTLYVHNGPQLDLRVVYNTDLFDPARIELLLAQYTALLAQVAADPERPLAAYSLRVPADGTMLPDAAAPFPAPPPAADLLTLFRQQAAADGMRTAVVEGEKEWSYAALAAESERIAAFCHARGAAAEDVVALYGPRSAGLVAGVLGVLQSGAAFLILDPAYPAARLRDYLAAARPCGLLQLPGAPPLPDELVEWVEGEDGRWLALPADWGNLPEPLPAPPPRRSDSLAYVLFTSGSTGEPKGILGELAPVSNFCRWQRETYQLHADDRFSMLSGLGHDPLLRDIFAPLTIGAALYIPDSAALLNPGYLPQWLRRHQITVVHLTPGLAELLAFEQQAGAEPLSLRLAFFGGERLTLEQAQLPASMAPGLQVVNFYGASETPQAMAHYPLPADPAQLLAGKTPAEVPIGAGIAGAQLLVLNEADQIAGIGEVGEICIRSPFLARGYLNGETGRLAFTGNPLREDPADRIYRTGDLGWYGLDGNVVYAGRRDRQVQLRGFRLEPAEVELALRAHPAVQSAAVQIVSAINGAQRLTAYVAAPALATDVRGAETLRTHLQGRLPKFMHPQAYVLLSQLPLTPNGKIDYAALPGPDDQPAAAAQETAPRTELEKDLLAIWRDVLGLETLRVTDDFFQVGGDSIRAVQLFYQIEQRLGISLPLTVLFERPTVAALAQGMEGGVGAEWSSLVPIKPSGEKRPFFCVHGGAGHVFHYHELAWGLGEERPFFGLQPLRQEQDSSRAAHSSVGEMAAHYVAEMRRRQPTGPYLLGGFCFGGMIAFEMAQQLQQQGERVAALVLIEPSMPFAERKRIYDAKKAREGWGRQAISARVRRHWRGLRKLPVTEWPAYVRKSTVNRRRQQANEQQIKAYYEGGQSKKKDVAALLESGEPIPAALQDRYFMNFVTWPAIRAYETAPYPGSGLLFRAAGQARDKDGRSLGWRGYFAGGLQVADVMTTHLEIMKRPSIQTVAAVLKAHLAEREGE